jgi:hypothetical protein
MLGITPGDWQAATLLRRRAGFDSDMLDLVSMRIVKRA